MAQKRRGKMTRKQRQRQLHRRMLLTGVLVVLICVGIYSGIRHLAKTEPAMSDALADGSSTQGGLTADDYSGSDYEDNDITDWTGAPPIDVELLTPNSWSRPQTRLKKVDGIVIHYTANPGSTAMQNRDYFENLPETQEAQASSHFVVGIEGEVVQCIRRVNGRMHRTSVISIRSRLNAATRMTAVNLPMRHTILWSSSPVSYASGSI